MEICYLKFTFFSHFSFSYFQKMTDHNVMDEWREELEQYLTCIDDLPINNINRSQK